MAAIPYHHLQVISHEAQKEDQKLWDEADPPAVIPLWRVRIAAVMAAFQVLEVGSLVLQQKTRNKLTVASFANSGFMLPMAVERDKVARYLEWCREVERVRNTASTDNDQ